MEGLQLVQSKGLISQNIDSQRLSQPSRFGFSIPGGLEQSLYLNCSESSGPNGQISRLDSAFVYRGIGFLHRCGGLTGFGKSWLVCLCAPWTYWELTLKREAVELTGAGRQVAAGVVFIQVSGCGFWFSYEFVSREFVSREFSVVSYGVCRRGYIRNHQSEATVTGAEECGDSRCLRHTLRRAYGPRRARRCRRACGG